MLLLRCLSVILVSTSGESLGFAAWAAATNTWNVKEFVFATVIGIVLGLIAIVERKLLTDQPVTTQLFAEELIELFLFAILVANAYGFIHRP